MIQELVALADELGTRAVAVTFDPPPLALLAPDRVPPQLTTPAQKVELLKSIGVDEVVICGTTPGLLSLTAEQFFEQVLVQQLGCQGIVEGPNFRFGHGRAGDINLLQKLCAIRQLPVSIVEAHEVDGCMISSSEVRTAINAANLRKARSLLGRPYSMTGIVSHGAERGRTLGFPTANLERIETLLPPAGVYAGRAMVSNRSYPIALNIGPNPTFGEQVQKIEAHLIGYSGDLYDQVLKIELLEFLRGVVTFTGVDALKSQLQNDIAQAIQCNETE